jgi:hypothetical protein
MAAADHVNGFNFWLVEVFLSKGKYEKVPSIYARLAKSKPVHYLVQTKQGTDDNLFHLQRSCTVWYSNLRCKVAPAPRCKGVLHNHGPPAKPVVYPILLKDRFTHASHLGNEFYLQTTSTTDELPRFIIWNFCNIVSLMLENCCNMILH